MTLLKLGMDNNFGHDFIKILSSIRDQGKKSCFNWVGKIDEITKKA
jgi:hypothetical protein